MQTSVIGSNFFEILKKLTQTDLFPRTQCQFSWNFFFHHKGGFIFVKETILNNDG